MVALKTSVLLVLSQDVLDRARVFAGKATISLKLPVSLQIVLRAFIEEGLRRGNDPVLLADVERQAQAVRDNRRVARQRRRAETDGNPRTTTGRRSRSR